MYLYMKTPTSASLSMLKLLTAWIKTNCGKFLEMGIPDHFTCLLRNLYADQEVTVRTRHDTVNWFKIGKGVYIKAVYCHHDYLTYMQSKYIMGSAGLDDSQGGIKTARGNVNTLRYADDTVLRAESSEELKSLLEG